MNLQELQKRLIENKFYASYAALNNEFVKQERVYLNINEQFQVFFISFDDKPFMKVYIQRAKDFDFKGIKQSDLETERCKKAKFQFLAVIKKLNIANANFENYERWEDVLLSPKRQSVKINVNV